MTGHGLFRRQDRATGGQARQPVDPGKGRRVAIKKFTRLHGPNMIGMMNPGHIVVGTRGRLKPPMGLAL